MLNTILAILPIFLIIAAGYVLRSFNVVKSNWISVLNRFVYYIALPAIIISSITGTHWSEHGVAPLLAWNLLGLLAFTAIVIGILKLAKLSSKRQAEIFLFAIVGNTVYLGLPVARAAVAGAMSESTLVAVGVTQLVAALVISLLAIEYVFLGTRDLVFVGKHLARNPLIIAIAIGFVLAIIGYPHWISLWLDKPLSMLGATASPVALFAMGAFIHGKWLKRDQNLLVGASALKFILLPWIMWLALSRSGQPVIAQHVSVLLAGMPVAVTAFALAEAYKLDEVWVAASMLLTTVLSVATIPIWLTLLGK
jgi:malonate transporter